MRIEFFILGRIGIIVYLIQGFIFSYAQTGALVEDCSVNDIYSLSLEKYGIDQQLANGIYFEDIYRNAIGHPYLGEDIFRKGRIVYHNRIFEGVEIKFDIFNEHLLLKHYHPDLITILTNEFVTAFSIDDKEFKKISFTDQSPVFYQEIVGKGNVRCYYSWFKLRKESIKDHQTLVSSFSKDKRKAYLLLHGVFSRYYGNASFKGLFPRDTRRLISNYLKTNKINVKNASDQEMEELILFCRQLLIQRKV